MSWEVGHEFAVKSYVVTRADLVRYAGASGDFNPIHWNDRIATSVGLPGVIAHGMYTLALASRAATTWAGSPDRVSKFGAKFTKPVVVPDDDAGTVVEVSGVVKSVEDGQAVVELTVTNDGNKVLGMCRATIEA